MKTRGFFKRSLFQPGQSLFDFRNNSPERIRSVFRKCREDFAVDRDVLSFEHIDECAVAHTMRSDGGIDAGDPEAAEVAFFVTAMIECMQLCVINRIACSALFGRSTESVTFDLA